MTVPTINGIPVLLPRHEHASFGKPGMHYHIDWCYHPGEPEQNDVVWDDGPIVYKDLPKIREVYSFDNLPTRVVLMLTEQFAGKRKSECELCPHKGLPVIGGMCVGHGLCFNDDGEVDKEFFVEVGPMRQRIDHTTLQIFGGRFQMEVTEDCSIDGYRIVSSSGKVVHQRQTRLNMRKGDFFQLQFSNKDT